MNGNYFDNNNIATNDYWSYTLKSTIVNFFLLRNIDVTIVLKIYLRTTMKNNNFIY